MLMPLDVKICTDIVNRTDSSCLVFRSPTDTSYPVVRTYIQNEHNGNARLRMEIFMSRKSTRSSLLSSFTKRAPQNMAKKIHRLTYATAAEMSSLLR